MRHIKRTLNSVFLLAAFLVLLCPVNTVYADDWSVFTVTMSTDSTLSAGQSVTFSINIKNNKAVALTPNIYSLYYQEEDSSGVDFGTISGDGYDSSEGSISLAANGEINLSLTGTIPETWNSKSQILIVVADSENEFYGQGNDRGVDPADGAHRTNTDPPADTTTPTAGSTDTNTADAGMSVGSIAPISAGKVTVTSDNTVAFTRADKAKKSITVPATVNLSGRTYNVTAVAAKAFKGSKATSVTIGKNVKTLKKNAFSGSKVRAVTVKTKSLTKLSVNGCLKGSKVRIIKVNIGKKKDNKKYAEKYKKIFTKKNAGRKVTVK